ncbi:MAG: DUF2812 domain-containing protein [Clostridia bacterium]|nr:DUF2812 domain-containing protein [Clostridia bacterium]
MEPKYRHRYPPCPAYDVGCMEAWLEQMAQQGLHLDGASGFFAGLATFTEGQPAQVKYRLEAVSKAKGFFEDNSAPADEAVEMAEEMGWEYVCRLREFDIYRSGSALTPELNTDPLLQAQSLKAVEKRMRGAVLHALFWWILYPLLRSLGPVYAAARIGGLLALWGWGLLVGQLLVAVYRLWFLARMRRELLRGAAPRRPKNLRKAGLRYRVGHGLHVAAAVLLTVTVLIQGFSGRLDHGEIRQPLADFPGDAPFPTIADLAPEEAVYAEEYFDFDDDENTFALWDALPVKRAILWEENAKLTFADGQRFTGGLYVEYYEAKNEWLADRLAKTLFRRDLASWNVEEIDLPNLGLDYARGTDRVFNTVILRQGNKVLRGYFYNTALRAIPWEDWLQATASALKE